MKRKKLEIKLSPMTKALIPSENTKVKREHNDAQKTSIVNTIASRLGTFSWTNYCHPTGVVKPVYYWIQSLSLTEKAV